MKKIHLFALVALFQFLLATGSAGQPVELSALDAQFQKLQKERVDEPYDGSLGKLNTSFLGALEKAIMDEKTAGNLDGVLALEAEKRRLSLASASDSAAHVPASDEANTPPALKKLRAVWRAEHDKLLSARKAAMELLLGPLQKRLAEMEADLTKADRLDDAKTVRAYREALQAGLPATQGSSSPGPDTHANLPEQSATKDGFTNSLGMRFVPVTGTTVLFCIHETRRQDYAAYANEVPGVDGSWRTQQRDGIPCGDKDDHPVVGVNWEDAVKFCGWLSKKEGKKCRLPTDEEWSLAAGLGRKEKQGKGSTPEMLNGKETSVFPWEGGYPPKTMDEAGNYADKSWHEKFPTLTCIEKYSDGFPTTAPVMSFKPNKLGLYDMGGNVWEWMTDWWNAEQKDRTLRGASFAHEGRDWLLASRRYHWAPSYRTSNLGFRVVLEAR